MNKIQKSFIGMSKWIAIVAFAIRWGIDKYSLSPCIVSSIYQLGGYAADAVLFTTIIMFAYEKWIWKKINIFKVPVLSKKYKGKLMFTWEDKMGERDAEIQFEQSLLSIKVKFRTNESWSHSIHAVIDDNNGYPRLMYYYLNEPDSNLRKISPIHYGHATLDLSNSEKLEGAYFTDRNTRGTIVVVPVKE